jgi:hypothetical protein
MDTENLLVVSSLPEQKAGAILISSTKNRSNIQIQKTGAGVGFYAEIPARR